MAGVAGLLAQNKPASQIVSTTGRSAAGSGQMKRVPIPDAAFGIAAYSINLPSDWKFEGKVLRRGGPCNTQTPNVVFRASSPDEYRPGSRTTISGAHPPIQRNGGRYQRAQSLYAAARQRERRDGGGSNRIQH